MREILFRGKRIDNGEYVYGYYCGGTYPCIYDISTIDYGAVEVIPETVGQYTGLVDKNGNKIFEGDICSCVHVEGLGGHPTTKTSIGVVEYIESGAFVVKCIHPGRKSAKDIYKRYFYLNFKREREFEVISNIHDTTDLINNQ